MKWYIIKFLKIDSENLFFNIKQKERILSKFNGIKFMKKNSSAKKNQTGVSMVELSVVLVIVALLSAAIFLGLQSNSRRVEAQDNVSQITEVAAGLRKSFGRSNSYAQLTAAKGTELAITSRIIPAQLRDGTAFTAKNSYGGPITIAVNNADCGAIAAACVNLGWDSIPQAQCVDLALGVEAGARIVKINAVTVKPLNGTIDLALLSTNCEAASAVPMTLVIGR